MPFGHHVKLGEIIGLLKNSHAAAYYGITDETEVEFLVYHAGHIGFQSDTAGARISIRPDSYPQPSAHESPTRESVAKRA